MKALHYLLYADKNCVYILKMPVCMSQAVFKICMLVCLLLECNALFQQTLSHIKVVSSVHTLIACVCVCKLNYRIQFQNVTFR